MVAVIFFVMVLVIAAEMGGAARSGECMLDEAGGGDCLPLDGDGTASVSTVDANFRLNNGVLMPMLGCGTAAVHSAGPIEQAIAAGCRHIDSARATEWYREEAAAQAISNMEQQGVLQPGEAFIVSKLHPRDFARDDALRGLRSSLEVFGRESLDLFLLHSWVCWPNHCNPLPEADWREAWAALTEAYDAGLARAIGVSNFPLSLLKEMEASPGVALPHVVQNRFDPFHQDRAVRKWCDERGILYTGYSALGDQWKYSHGLKQNPVSANPVIRAIAQAHNTSVQQVTLSWALQSKVAVLPRSTSPAHIVENARMLRSTKQQGQLQQQERQEQEDEQLVVQQPQLDVFLTPGEVAQINALDGAIDSFLSGLRE